MAWIGALQAADPADHQPYAPWNDLANTLMPILSDQVAGLFLPWSDANSRALAGGEETFTVQLSAGVWQQQPQKYHARSLAALRAKWRTNTNLTLAAVMRASGCGRWLDAEA